MTFRGQTKSYVCFEDNVDRFSQAITLGLQYRLFRYGHLRYWRGGTGYNGCYRHTGNHTCTNRVWID